jgi:hypothetical protein
MNYAGPIMLGVWGVSWIWYKLYWVSVNTTYYLYGSDGTQTLQHRNYHGPGNDNRLIGSPERSESTRDSLNEEEKELPLF